MRARQVNPAGSARSLLPRCREVTRLRAHAAGPGTDALRVATLNRTMDLQLLIAQWSGAFPPGFVRRPLLQKALPECSQPRCRRPVSVKKNGELAKSCARCLARRAESCRRRRAHFVAQGGCRRCAYRKRLESDLLCKRCRADRDRERQQSRQDARDAAIIDEFAAGPDRAHNPSNLDCGISPWNARPKPQPSAAYWSPLPDPEPREEREWAHSIHDTRLRFRRH